MDYKEILKGIVTIINTTEKSDIGFANICGYIGKKCPELAESEDEKIRKWIIDDITFNMNNEPLNNSEYRKKAEKAVAWLEKQGEKDILEDAILDSNEDGLIAETIRYKHEKQGEKKASCTTIMETGDGGINALVTLPIEMKTAEESLGIDSDTYNKIVDECIFGEQKPANKIEPKDYSSIDPHFGKPIDKVEPKFHEGEWIVHHGTENIYQVVAVIDNQYQLKYGNTYTVQKCADVDRCARLWDIIKDAKKGDVLTSDYEGGICIALLKNVLSISEIEMYCHLINDDLFIPKSGYSNAIWHPATKEQRDTLMKAMANAGYTFDFEKKELLVKT